MRHERESNPYSHGGCKPGPGRKEDSEATITGTFELTRNPRNQMLFTWSTQNLCIVFESWHIRSTAGLIFSLLAVILIGMGYEALRAGTRRYEIVTRRRLVSTPSECLLRVRS